MNVPKQLLTNFYLRSVERHLCMHKKKIVLKNTECERSNDTLLKMRHTGEYFRVLQILPRDIFIGEKINTTPYYAPGLDHLPWNAVGVRKFQEWSGEESHLHLQDIECKLILNANTIVEAPLAWIVS